MFFPPPPPPAVYGNGEYVVDQYLIHPPHMAQGIDSYNSVLKPPPPPPPPLPLSLSLLVQTSGTHNLLKLLYAFVVSVNVPAIEVFYWPTGEEGRGRCEELIGALEDILIFRLCFRVLRSRECR